MRRQISSMLSGVAALLVIALLTASCAGDNDTITVYSGRTENLIGPLLDGFADTTGVDVEVRYGQSADLALLISQEGERSPADVFITVDVARLWRAQQMGLFQPVKSKVLEERIPAHLREPGGHWFGFSKRARVIFYNKAAVKPGEIRSYQDLADPRFKGRVCIRSLNHVYNLSLMSALVDNLGEQRAQQWAQGLKANLARSPKGGDTDQIRAVAAGECDIGVANTYYYVRLAKSSKAADRAVAEKVGVVFPDQDGFGTHVNVSGGGVARHAPHRENAVRFLEYLASPDAQSYFANGNNEWPAVPGTSLDNPALVALGTFKEDKLNVGVLGNNQPLAQKVFNIVGLK